MQISALILKLPTQQLPAKLTRTMKIPRLINIFVALASQLNFHSSRKMANFMRFGEKVCNFIITVILPADAADVLETSLHPLYRR